MVIHSPVFIGFHYNGLVRKGGGFAVVPGPTSAYRDCGSPMTCRISSLAAYIEILGETVGVGGGSYCRGRLRRLIKAHPLTKIIVVCAAQADAPLYIGAVECVGVSRN